MKTELTIASKLYECQKTAKMLFKDEYEAKTAWHKKAINNYASKYNCDTLKAVFEICKLDPIKDEPFTIMLFMASAVDIIEANPCSE